MLAENCQQATNEMNLSCQDTPVHITCSFWRGRILTAQIIADRGDGKGRSFRPMPQGEIAWWSPKRFLCWWKSGRV